MTHAHGGMTKEEQNMSKEKQQDPTNGEETKAPVEKKTSKIKTGKVANCERLNVCSTPKQEPGGVS